MITRNRMMFLAPEGDAGGGAAVAELEPLPNMGEAFKHALAKERGEDPPPAKGPTGPVGGPGVVGITGLQDGPGPTGPAPTGPSKPASALDAALEGVGQTGATGPAASDPAEDYLKDLPETLPREGRKDHWEKARGAISKLSTTVAQFAKEKADFAKQLEEAKAAPTGSAEREAALQKQLDEYKDAIVAINVEYSPDHQQKFVAGRAALVEKAATKAHAFGGDSDKIKEALAMSEGRGRSAAIKEALANIDEEYDRGRVLDLIQDVAKLDDEKGEIMKDPQGAWSKLQVAEKARADAAAQQAQEFKKSVFEAVSKELPETMFLLREVDPALPGAPEHNANAKAMRESAFKLLGPDAKPKDLVEAAFWKQAGPKLQELYVGSRKELATALGALKEYEGADPGFKGGKAPQKTGVDAALDESPGDRYKRSMREQSGGD